MDFIKFKEKEIIEDILVEAGDFEVICFEGNRNDRVQISAWEVDGEPFDIFLLKESDIFEDTFHEERAVLSKRSCKDFEGTYTFDIKDTRCLVLSNIRAYTRDKLVRLHLTRIEPKDLLNDKRGDIQKQESHGLSKSQHSELSTKAKLTGTLLSILIMTCLVIYAITGIAVAGAIAAILATLTVAIFRDVISKKLGLAD
jgi:hypothetical protein